MLQLRFVDAYVRGKGVGWLHVVEGRLAFDVALGFIVLPHVGPYTREATYR